MITKSATLSNDSRYYITLELEETNINIDTNKSDIRYVFSITKKSGTGYYNDNPRNPVVIVIDGETVVNQKIVYDFRGGSPKTVVFFSGVKEGIEHNSDGTKKINFSASFEDVSNQKGTAYVSGEYILKTIARATNFNNEIRSIGENNPIILRPNSDLFTHSLYVEIGNKKGYINSIGVIQEGEYKLHGKSVPLNITSDYYSYFSENSKIGIMRLTTYNNGVQVGNKVEKELKINVNSGKPSYTLVSFEDLNTDVASLTGSNKRFISGYSNIKFDFTFRASEVEEDINSRITNVTLNDKEIIGNTITLDKITSEVYNNLKLVIENSRGIKEEYILNIDYNDLIKETDIIEYMKPTAKAKFYRENQTSDQVKLDYEFTMFEGKYSDLDNAVVNEASVKTYYREAGESEWKYVEDINSSAGSGDFEDGKLLGLSYSYQNSYEFKFEVKDKMCDVLGLDSIFVVQTVTAGLPNFSIGEGWFQHHTEVYDKNGKKLSGGFDLDSIYPKGSIYMTVNPEVKPKEIFGGEWKKIEGKFLLGASTDTEVGKTGGSSTHTHSYSHTHNVPGQGHSHGLGSAWAYISIYAKQVFINKRSGVPAWWDTYQMTGSSYGTGGTGSSNSTATNLGGSTDWSTPGAVTTNSQSVSETGSASNMPPYLAVYMWQRTE